jgi:Uma2 family endonuclease
MTAIQPRPNDGTMPRQWPLSVASYHALGDMGLIPERTELLYGQVFHKMPKSPLHSALLRRLLRLLNNATIPGYFVSQEQPITCPDSEPEPDLAVIRGSEDDFWQAHPATAELVIEICVTSHDYDRSKLRAYATAGVRECWLVLAPEKQVEVYRRPLNGEYAERLVRAGDQALASAAVPGVEITLSSLWEITAK